MRSLTFRASATLVLLAACAHLGPPPGGPPRFTPPVLEATEPDTIVSLPGFRGRASFEFDEVFSEGSTPNFGYGNGSLEMLVLLSPDTAVPSVEWHRNRLSVRPRHGWRPNTVYRIELLPGLADLQARPNVTKKTSVITFTTGDSLPTRYLVGRAIDWAGDRAVPSALIDAFHLPDSAGYRTIADSAGRFRLGPLPNGGYLVEAVDDADRNHRRNSREAWDTVRVGSATDSVGEIWIFTRDTLPPRLQTLARQDSTGVALTFSEPIDPYQVIPADSIRVLLLPDSLSVGPIVGRPKALDDSLQPKPIPAARTPHADSVARRDSLARDSVKRADANRPPSREERAAARAAAARIANLPQQKRRALGEILIVRTTGILQPGHRYYVDIRGVRTAGGKVGPVARAFDVPKESVDTTARADSLKAKLRADSTRGGKADSLGHSTPDSTVHPKIDSTGRAKPGSTVRPRSDSAAVRRR